MEVGRNRELITRKEAAEIIGCSISTLGCWAFLKRGPKVTRWATQTHGRGRTFVLYDAEDVRDFAKTYTIQRRRDYSGAAQMYAAGNSLQEVGAAYGVSRQAVQLALKKAGCPMRGKGSNNKSRAEKTRLRREARAEQAYKLWNRHHSIRKVANAMGVLDVTARAILKAKVPGPISWSRDSMWSEKNREKRAKRSSKILYAYMSRVPVRRIAERFRLSVPAVYRILQLAGVHEGKLS